jgi:hypothetical protein
MAMNQPDTAAAKHHPQQPPDFRVVLRGYDRAEVDEYLPSSWPASMRRWTATPKPNRHGPS